MKASVAFERHYVLPCCLLLLNLCNEIISYKAKLIHDDLLRTLFIMAMVLFGASLVAFAVAPESSGRCSRYAAPAGRPPGAPETSSFFSVWVR